MNTHRLWTKDEIATLRRLYQERKSWEDMAEILGRTSWACRSKMHDLIASHPYRNGGRKSARIETCHTIVIPDHILADRDARYEASYRRTQTQEFFGDPPPGYSALDRKRQAEAQPR